MTTKLSNFFFFGHSKEYNQNFCYLLNTLRKFGIYLKLFFFTSQLTEKNYNG